MLLLSSLALTALVLAVAARADGDPASDILAFQSVYFPNQAPSPSSHAALEQAVRKVYLGHDRLRVALVHTADDLGAIPSLFNKPADYARFLGLEIQFYYVGPLLVVMPSGFGIFDGGRSTAAEERILSSLRVAGGSPDELTHSATVAVQRLRAAGALQSPDILRPQASAIAATVVRGKPAKLRYDVYDDSGWSRGVVRVKSGSSLIAKLTSPQRLKVGTRQVAVTWHVPKRLPGGTLRFCVFAFDPDGNRSNQSCVPIVH